jgi:hypothetical protein
MLAWATAGPVWAALGGGLAIEVVDEDGFDRAGGPCADLQRPQAGRLDPFPAIGFDQPDDAQAGAEALLGMTAVLQDQIAQHGRGRTDG